MPDLIQSLHGHDLGHLRIVAELWGVDLSARDADAACRELAAALKHADLVAEIVETLPAEARAALHALVTEEGRMPWATFVRRFGEVREMGPGRRDREMPHRNPVSAAEMLFYRALLARAFFDTPGGPQEFAYLPDDLLPLVADVVGEGDDAHDAREPLGRPASPSDRAHILPADDSILDDACTLLAALRLSRDTSPHPTRVPVAVLRALLTSAGLLDEEGAPRPDVVRAFLEAPRHEALASLVATWRASETFNELCLVPGLVCEGEWKNDPLTTRRTLLRFLARLPSGKWWSLGAFAAAIKECHPDFQRPAGDYDSWFIRRAADGEYLRGFEHWDEVDGALIRYFVTGPLHWLGLADLASRDVTSPPAAFRLTVDPAALVEGEITFSPVEREERVHVTSRGRIDVPRLASRVARYQIARFCEWDDLKGGVYRYHVTPRSLARAARQGLKVAHLLAVLKSHVAAPLPPVFVRALKRWETKGVEARMESVVVLRLGSPRLLEELRRSKAARFLGESLGPAAVVVRKGAQANVLAALAEMGLLADDRSGEEN